jgi:large subunit ribosomal protein L30e
MDLGTSIRMAADTGKMVIGADKTRKLALNGKPKLVVVASNCPAEIKQDLEHFCKLSKIAIFAYPGTVVELGTACGKPFGVSTFAVLDFGNSDLGELVKTK